MQQSSNSNPQANTKLFLAYGLLAVGVIMLFASTFTFAFNISYFLFAPPGEPSASMLELVLVIASFVGGLVLATIGDRMRKKETGGK